MKRSNNERKRTEEGERKVKFAFTFLVLLLVGSSVFYFFQNNADGKGRASGMTGAVIASQFKEKAMDLGPYWIAFITVILIFSAIIGGVCYYRKITSQKHIIISSSKPPALSKPKQNIHEQMYQKELSQLNQKISGSPVTFRQNPTPASTWDAQLQAIDNQLSKVEQSLPRHRVITDLPPTRGYAREAIEIHPEELQKMAKKNSKSLVQRIKKPHLLLTKSIIYKKKMEEEKKAEQEYKRLLELHWKVDHYSELSTLEKLQLEEELNQIEKKVKQKN
ncbi:MAG: hypothetical protein AABX04_06665 [Nanoarchaeota archaeon]